VACPELDVGKRLKRCGRGRVYEGNIGLEAGHILLCLPALHKLHYARATPIANEVLAAIFPMLLFTMPARLFAAQHIGRPTWIDNTARFLRLADAIIV